MSRKTENEKNAGSSVNDLESLTTSLCLKYIMGLMGEYRKRRC